MLTLGMWVALREKLTSMSARYVAPVPRFTACALNETLAKASTTNLV